MIQDSRRRQARELTLQILFQFEFAPELNEKSSLDYFKSHFEGHPEVFSYAQHLVEGVRREQENIDTTIKQKSLNWNFERIATVDKNILRIALFEILHSNGEVPPITAIDEALDIAKKYSGTDSGQFINGILDSVIKENNLTE